MTREERKEQADMRDEYHAMEERVAALETALNTIIEIADRIAVIDIARAALKEAEG